MPAKHPTVAAFFGFPPPHDVKPSRVVVFVDVDIDDDADSRKLGGRDVPADTERPSVRQRIQQIAGYGAMRPLAI
jgi:hypothetical protein